MEKHHIADFKDRRGRQFIADCRWIAEALGEVGKAGLSSSVTSPALRYEDKILTIEASVENRALLIEGHGEKMGGLLKLRNPVVYIDQRGYMYRWHGEARYLFDHARHLVLCGTTIYDLEKKSTV